MSRPAKRSIPVGNGQSESSSPRDVADRIALQRQRQHRRQSWGCEPAACSRNRDGTDHAQSDPEIDTMRDHVIHFHGFREKTANEFMTILDEAGVKTEEIDIYVHPADDAPD